MHKGRKLDISIIIPIIIFFIISITSIYSAMTYLSPDNGNLVLKQIIWYIIGIGLIIVLFKLKNDYLYRNAWFLYIIGNILLLSLLLFAPEINNSKCWFVIPYIGSFQPSEFMKIFIMLILGVMISNFRDNTDHPSTREEAIFIIKTEFIKKQAELMKIAEVQATVRKEAEEQKRKDEEEKRRQEKEKEEQKEARARMREEAKLAKEIEEERKKLEKEQKHYQNALKKIIEQLKDARDEDRAAIEEKKEEIETQLQKIDSDFKNVDYREANQRAGYVYVISNIGAFGENVYKIGMTRRLDPMDRVDELGDASVPFDFDVHAMIFSDDAPKLEAALHKAFASRKLNFVNQRREFFNVTLDEIKQVVKENFDKSVEFIDLAPAEQYRESLLLKKQMYPNET